MTAYIKFQDRPGVFKDDTPLTASMFYVDSDKIRWRRGKWEIIGGWERATSSSFLGICRGLLAWRDNTAQPYGAIGTHLRAYCLFDSILYDTTPVASRTAGVSVSLTTVSGSATVTASSTAHGLVADQKFGFEGSTVASVGGVTVNGTYVVDSVADANTFTYTAAQTASASAGPTAATVSAIVYLAPGLVDNLGGLGFGVGGFGLGGFGAGASVTTLYPRTWSLDNWGQNLLANPRGGGLYEWAPATSAAELVTNGDMSSGTGWTPGTGWSIAAGTATAAAGSGSDLAQTLTLPVGAWCLLQFDYTRSAGTLQPKVNGTALGSGLSAASGHPFLVFHSGAGGSQALTFAKDATFAGTVDTVSVKQILTLELIPEAPAQNACMVVTPEDMVMVGGTIDAATGNFDPLLLRWCARRNNRLWVPGFDEGNTSGFYRLARGSRIVKLLIGRGEIIVHTDEGIYVGRFNPDPTINYSFTYIGVGGLIGPNAATFAGDADYFVSPANKFLRYAGGAIETLACTVQRDFAENLSPSQFDKIYAAGIDAFGEAIFLYPDIRDGTECSRYVKVNLQESDLVWDVGSFPRSAWIASTLLGFPLAAGTDGVLYFQEKGDAADGGPLSGFIESGAFSLTKGSIAAVMAIIPDFKGLRGALSMTVKAYLYPAAAVETLGPYTITAATQKIDLRTQGRQLSLRFDWNSLPAFARQGTIQGDVMDTETMR